MAKKKRANIYSNPNRKTRSYLEIIYPESAPPNFVETLKAEVDRERLRYFILSPLHDLDLYDSEDAMDDYLNQTNSKVGQYKKPHYHGIFELQQNYPMQQSTANNYFKQITNGTIVKPRENLKGAVRYLAHLDEDQTIKAAYNPDLIYTYGNINIQKFLEEGDKSMSSLMAWEEIMSLIDENDIQSIYDFEHFVLKQDVDLKLQLQKNVNLRSRCISYIRSRNERALLSQHNLLMDYAEKLPARLEADKLIRGGATRLYANQKFNEIFEKIEEEKEK